MKRVISSRLAACVIICLSPVAIARSFSADTAIIPALSQATTQVSPRIKNARLKGSKIIVTGEQFDGGSVILINGEAVKTRADLDFPSARLIAKKAAKSIELDTAFVVTVRNSDGEESNELLYFRGTLFIARVLPVGQGSHAVYLEVGDYILTTINLNSATRLLAAPNILTRVFEVPLPSTEFWLYQAFQPGVGQFHAEIYHGGEAPPILLYDVGIIVE